MLLPLALALAAGGADPVPGRVSDAFLGTDQGVCLATGYCSAPGPGRGGAPPGGLMYVVLGLVGSGVIVLRTERR